MIHIKEIFKIEGNTEQLFQKTHYLLDAKGKEQVRRVFDEKERLKLQTFFTYNDNHLLTKTVVRNSKDDLLSFVELRYDSNLQLVKRSFYDRNGKLVAQHIWEYDNTFPERLLRYLKIGKDGKPLFLKKFKYDTKGNLVKEEHFSADGRLVILKLKRYDEQSREKSETVFENGNILKVYKLILYNAQNLPIEISWYDSQDKIQRLECFDYNDNGLLSNEVILDFYGNRSFFKRYNNFGKIEYLLRKYNRQPVAEETYQYDSKGRLILRKKYTIQEDKKTLTEEERHWYENSD